MPSKRPEPPPGEAEFLAAYDAERFERPSLAVDMALVTLTARGLGVAVVPRTEHPDRGRLALPGGFVGIAESLGDAAVRVLRTKLGVRDVFFEQLYTFGRPDRDPRARIVSVAHYALVDETRLRGQLVPEARVADIEVPWAGETGGPVELEQPAGTPVTLAFDHADIVGMAVKRLRGKLGYAPIGYQLLPPRFTLRRLKRVHEAVLGTRLNKDSFRRRMLASGDLDATGEYESEVGHRPAELYRFARRSAV